MFYSRLPICLVGLGIAVLMVVIISHHTAYGELCAFGPQNGYNMTDEVFLGQIISKEPFKFSYTNMKMTLHVKEVFKGKYNDTLTVFYNDCGEAMGCNDSSLEKGKWYVVYGHYSGNNLLADFECGFIQPADTYAITEVSKLAHVEMQNEKTVTVSGTNFTLNYTTTGDIKITNIHVDKVGVELVISFNSQCYCNLTITLPRDLIDAKINGNDAPFPWSYSGNDVLDHAIEKKDTPTYRTIIIPLEPTNGTATIGIGGSQVIPEFGSLAGMIIAISIIGVVIISRRFRSHLSENNSLKLA